MPRKRRRKTESLEVVNRNCAGIDIGKDVQYVAFDPDRCADQVRSFDAFTRDLEEIASWLSSCGVETVAMESTSVYWISVYEVLETGMTQAAWQRCYVHFLRNALDHMPRKRDDACPQELRWLYDRRNLKEARTDLAGWLTRWQAKYPKLTARKENTIEENPVVLQPSAPAT